MTKGCPKLDSKLRRRVFPQPRSLKHFVRCCQHGSSTAEDACTSEPCQGKQTYDDALKICVDKGMVLCSEPDLDDYCCGKGCWHDRKWVWVSNHGRYILQIIND